MGVPLGIMTHTFSTRSTRLIQLDALAKQEGFSHIVVYTPLHVYLKQRKVKGYRLTARGWRRCIAAMPRINHDIGYYSRKDTLRKVRHIKMIRGVEFTAYSLGNKWTLYRTLMTSESLSPYLIPTFYGDNPRTIDTLLQKYSTIMIKPLNGKGGKGIIRIGRSAVGQTYEFILSGHHPKTISHHRYRIELHRIVRNGRYIIPPWIDFRQHDHRVFDIRVLVQKDRQGMWLTAGSGIREGQHQAITSNLSGGGRAASLTPYLLEQFNEAQVDALQLQVDQMCRELPAFLEHSYGRRFAELGIDLAVNRDGKLYLIEVNIKPGTNLFRALFNQEAYIEVLRRPVQFAAYLVNLNPNENTI